MARKPKYNKKLVKRITDLIKKDSYTIAEICTLSGISQSTYFEWKATKPEFSEEVKNAEDERMKFFAVEAKKSLLKLIQGYDVEEKSTTFVDGKDNKPKIKEQKVIKKHYQPNTGAVIFALTNTEPENWKNRMNNELTGKDGKELMPARILTKKELKDLLSDLENEC